MQTVGQRREEWPVGAELGTVTIGGDPAAVQTCGEVRDLPVYGPGGYHWAPKRGDSVLVIKGGPGGEEQCIAGAASGGEMLEPGEILIRTGEATLRMSADGRIDLNGNLYINGEPYVAPLTE